LKLAEKDNQQAETKQESGPKAPESSTVSGQQTGSGPPQSAATDQDQVTKDIDAVQPGAASSSAG
jgi:hypothetical protein